MAAALTLFIVAALTIYACNNLFYIGVTKSDLTGCGVYLFILSMVMLVFGIVCIFWKDPIVQLIYSCLSALLFSVYLVFDTQLVIGNGRNSYTLDDAYLAAIQLYIDVMELFLNLLRIVSYI
jgi:FtsH-binding integral membrane protein